MKRWRWKIVCLTFCLVILQVAGPGQSASYAQQAIANVNAVTNVTAFTDGNRDAHPNVLFIAIDDLGLNWGFMVIN